MLNHNHIEDVKIFKETLESLTLVALDFPRFGNKFFNEPIKISVMGVSIELQNNAQLHDDLLELLCNYMEEMGA